jgi:hypothetical protein
MLVIYTTRIIHFELTNAYIMGAYILIAPLAVFKIGKRTGEWWLWYQKHWLFVLKFGDPTSWAVWETGELILDP